MGDLKTLPKKVVARVVLDEHQTTTFEIDGEPGQNLEVLCSEHYTLFTQGADTVVLSIGTQYMPGTAIYHKIRDSVLCTDGKPVRSFIYERNEHKEG